MVSQIYGIMYWQLAQITDQDQGEIINSKLIWCILSDGKCRLFWKVWEVNALTLNHKRSNVIFPKKKTILDLMYFRFVCSDHLLFFLFNYFFFILRDFKWGIWLEVVIYQTNYIYIYIFIFIKNYLEEWIETLKDS